MKKLIGMILMLMLVLSGCGGNSTEADEAAYSQERAIPEVVTFRSTLDFYFGFEAIMEWFEVDEGDVQYNDDGSITVALSPEVSKDFSQELQGIFDYNMEWLATERLVGVERAEIDEDLLTMTWYIYDEELFGENYLTGLFDFFMHELGLLSYVNAIVSGISFYPDGFTVIFYYMETGEQQEVYRFLDDDGAFETPQEPFELEK